ncbi:MAG TPA: HEAT repeat domain-containing protein, partial [Gemmatimonadales bacterium]|nr:HEAT repeat domain-containing protein [Gemmatimonadales bacterium]
MITAHLVAATLASLAHLLRHAPTARDEQDVTVDHLGRLAGTDGPLVIEAGLESLTINGTLVPMESPGASILNELILLHGIRRAEFTTPLISDRVMGLCTVLAAFPGTFESFAEVEQACGAGIETGLSLAEAPSDLTFERFTATIPLMPDPEARPLIELEDVIRPAEDGGLLPHPDLDGLTDFDAEMPDEPDRVRLEPSGNAEDDFHSRLNSILDRGRLAGRTENWEELLRTALEIIEIEAEAPTEAVGKAIRIELRRLLPKAQLHQIARLASSGGRKQDAIAILRYLGADSTEVLMDLLVDEISMAGRRGYYSALTHMSEGHGVIIAHLQHQTWYVVRNAAELCGEMDLERAVPELHKQASHEDERVRRAVAGALAKIGSPSAMEPLRKLLTDRSAAVRLRAVSALNPRRARAIVMPLAAMLEHESEGEIIKAAALALARIGTPDALQALAAYARPNPKLFGL